METIQGAIQDFPEEICGHSREERSKAGAARAQLTWDPAPFVLLASAPRGRRVQRERWGLEACCSPQDQCAAVASTKAEIRQFIK